MDVQAPELTPRTNARAWRWAAILAVLLLALGLRLHGIGHPILDHPGWRQGDTAAVARNFARLQYDVMRPQTTYNGPPPNYVELELQIVPFAAATLDKVFGIHEIFGRLATLIFSLATCSVLFFFGRWLFWRFSAGLAAALCYAVFPGSVYYGRTFTPDAAMVFFLTAALYACARLLLEDARMPPRSLARATALLTFAYLAKPVAVLALVPLAALVVARARAGLPSRATAIGVLFVVPLLILAWYDRTVSSYAQWHWASGITTLHVLPSLRSAFSSPALFAAKLSLFRSALGMLRQTMLASLGFWCASAAFVALGWIGARSRALLWCWLGSGLVYIFVVVTVERVDYYMLALLPACALAIGGAVAALWAAAMTMPSKPARYGVVAALALLGVGETLTGRAAVAPYYAYNPRAYAQARQLSALLDPNALIVLAHYGPDVQYYIDRFGWEEDPAIWTPFDEQSAIRKGARYFISVEDNRLRRNGELCAWLQRFPLLPWAGDWPVYRTDPRLISSAADAFWRAYRDAERSGRGAQFLQHVPNCAVSP